MHRGRTWWAATLAASLALLLVLANAVLVWTNQSAAVHVGARREFIAQTPRLARVSQLAVNALAGPAASDEAIRALLVRSGSVAAPPP